jgi:putative tricarboxylic transport membrane protein
VAKKMSKDGASFGTGRIEGVIAPETAAHAAGTSALLPMLALGVPGSPTAAVLLGGLMMWGLQPGPMLFVEQKDFVWGLIASMYLGNIAGLIIVLAAVPVFAAILRGALQHHRLGDPGGCAPSGPSQCTRPPSTSWS